MPTSPGRRRAARSMLLCTDPDYPPLLAASAVRPPRSTCRARSRRSAAPQLAMVGSRSPTPAGRATAREFAACFARGRAHHHQRARRSASMRRATRARCAGGGRPSPCAARPRPGLPGGARSAGRAHPRARRAGVGVSAAARRRGARISRGATASSAACALGTLVVEAARLQRLADHRAAGARKPGARCLPSPAPSTARCHAAATNSSGTGRKLVEEAGDVLTELQISIAERTTYGRRPRGAGKAPGIGQGV